MEDIKNNGPWDFTKKTWSGDGEPFDFTKQPDKTSYNEGDEIATKASPVFNTDFTGIPITPTHKPCGYWHSTPADEIGGDPPSIYADKCDDSKMAWDSGTSAATIGRSDSVLIAITDDEISGSPYIWELDAQSIANGFSLVHSKTIGLTNHLRSDSGACGSALIRVTGCDGLGTYVQAYVLCTYGDWSVLSECNGRTNPGCTAWECYVINHVDGIYRYDISFNVCNQTVSPGCCSDAAITSCGACPDGEVYKDLCVEGQCSPCCDCKDICFSDYVKTYEWTC